MTKKLPSRFALLLMMVGAMAARLPAQVESADPNADIDRAFFVETLAFAGSEPGQSRLDVFVQVGYKNLSFVKNDNLYDASYELTISIHDSAQSLAGEKLWSEEVKGVQFDESVSGTATRTSQRSFNLAPGQYSVVVQFRDLESKSTQRLSREVRVRDFSLPRFSVSDIMLISRVTMQGDRANITPSISTNMGVVPDLFHIYFEVYSPDSGAFRLAAVVFDEKKDAQSTSDTVRNLHPGRNEILMAVDHSKLVVGDYKLTVALYSTPAREDQQPLAAAARAFIVRWRGLPLGVKNLDIAIEELKYIAKEGEVSHIKEAATLEEKQARFFEFWKKRDPNPNTPRNERMEEYYARVEYANKHFKHYTEGWRTDMGMVYIVLGPPSNVDRHPFEMDSKPYEVWAYYELNQTFVFVDETGFGDYRLITPLWEVWQKAKN